MKRTQKIALIHALLSGTATPKQINDLRKSQEPMQLTMILDDGIPTPDSTTEPVFCIDCYSDGTTHCYDRYPDGRIETRTN